MVAKQMKAYEDQLYEQWKENVHAVLQTLLKRNLLIKPGERVQPVPTGDQGHQEDQEDEGGQFPFNVFNSIIFFLCFAE